MKYRGYLNDLATAFRHRFEQISTHFNFDHGDEFEIALCYVLREILPQKYGICRGFVVPADGPAAGDDIIISSISSGCSLTGSNADWYEYQCYEFLAE